MDWTYIIAFTSLLTIANFYGKVNEANKLIIQYICLNFLIFFFGLHGNVGDDYETYRSFYYSPTFKEVLVFGPLFSILTYILSLLHLPFQCLIFLLSIITNTLLLRFIRKTSANIPFVIAIFFALGGIINEIDFIRNILGLVLFVNSIEYIDKRDVKKFFAMNFAGFLCHYSSIIYFPLYWLGRKSLKLKHVIYLLLVGFILAPLHLPLLGIFSFIADDASSIYINHIYKYIESFAGLKLNFSFGSIERMLTGVLICVFYSKLKKDTLGRVSIFAFLAYYLCYTVLSNYAVLATRLGNLFVFAYWILLPRFIEYIPGKIGKRCYMTFIYLYMFFRLLSISMLPQWEYQLCL